VDETEEALVRRSQALDRAAFEELVRRTGRLVFCRAYLETGDVHRAEDLTQETFLAAWRSIQQVSEPAGFRSWLLTIAKSVAIDGMRREGRKKRSGSAIEGKEVFPKLADPGDGPVENAESREQRQQMMELLRSLPQEYREPLMLRYIAGADYQTIGQQLGLSNGSLRGLLHRGIAKLREQMKNST
jgi:RNA polymerase sigma-70 factor, ECF subfamily